MGDRLKALVSIAIVLALFLTVFLPRCQNMPQHIDEWVLIGIADEAINQGYYPDKEPWTHGTWSYPPGSHLLVASLSQISGLDLLKIAQLLPAILFAVLGLLNYSLAKFLFRKEWAALAVMAFTVLIFSNITMMGNYYMVPLAFGVVLGFTFFNLLVRGHYVLASAAFVLVALTHSSTFLFVVLTTGLFFLFEPKYRKPFLFLLLAILGIGFLTLTRGLFERSLMSLINIFKMPKDKPYFNFAMMTTNLFVVLIGLGVYLVLTKEKKATRFLVPIFTFQVIDLFMYWHFHGFLILYRRLIYHIFLFVPFFVGYAVHWLSEWTRKLPWKWFKGSRIPFIVLLLILVPIGVNLNVKEHQDSEIYVSNQENLLFAEFSKEHPGEYLATNHLQAYALPYYGLKPVQLSPSHIDNDSHFEELSPCFVRRDSTCLEEFFQKTWPKYRYLYTGTLVNSSSFVPAYTQSNLVIYESNLNAGG